MDVGRGGGHEGGRGRGQEWGFQCEENAFGVCVLL